MPDNSRVRISIVGVVILALFSSLLARLWFLQMGPERNLKQEAVLLSTRKIQTESPRGSILDRNGVPLATSRAAWAITLDRNLKRSVLARVLGRLSEVLSTKEETLRFNYNSQRQSPLKPAIVALDVSQDDRLSILEHMSDYPGVNVALLTVRDYPQGAADALNDPILAAQVLGYVGEIDKAQLARLKKRGYQAGDTIGRAGIESAYESVLRGAPEIETVQVDPTGKQVGAPLSVQSGSVGDNVSLTIDAKLQKVTEQALQDGMTAARKLAPVADDNNVKHPVTAPAGSALVMDVRDGSILAMASNPAFPPAGYVGGLSQANADLLASPFSNNPSLNRATQGQYAPGSTFKVVTSLAETRFGFRSAFFQYNDTGSVTIGGDKRSFHNDNHVSYGSVALARALTVSSDTYFYSVGNDFWGQWFAGDKTRGLGIQQQARDLGLGAPTGIEIDENEGRVPDPTWKQNFADLLYKDPQQRHDNGAWYPGDQVNMAVGQGDVLVTPLQLADAYACFANGGTLWEPRLAFKVTDPEGRPIRLIPPKARAHMTFDATTWGQMMSGFSGAVQSKDGTAFAAFQGSSIQSQVAGKTGTAQVANKAPTSVFVGMYPSSAPQYVVVAFVEQGGHGAQTAAPIVRRIIEELAHVPNPAPIVASTGHD